MKKVHRINDVENFQKQITALCAEARYTIDLFSPVLERHVFDHTEFTEALSRFITQRRGTLQILIENSSQVLRDNARLTALCRRASDFCQIKQVSEQHRGASDRFIIIDNESYLKQSDIGRTDAIIERQSRANTKPLCSRFLEMWNEGLWISEFSTAGL